MLFFFFFSCLHLLRVPASKAFGASHNTFTCGLKYWKITKVAKLIFYREIHASRKYRWIFQVIVESGKVSLLECFFQAVLWPNRKSLSSTPTNRHKTIFIFPVWRIISILGARPVLLEPWHPKHTPRMSENNTKTLELLNLAPGSHQPVFGNAFPYTWGSV